MRKNKKEKGRRKMQNVKGKTPKKTEDIFGVYQLEISTGKKLEILPGKIQKSDSAPPPKKNKFPVMPLTMTHL